MLAGFTPKEVQAKYRHSICLAEHDFDVNRVEYAFGLHDIGFAELEINEKEKGLSWVKFYPFAYKIGKQYKNQGIGTLATIAPLVSLINRGFLDEKYNYSFSRKNISGDRKAHYAEVGIDICRKSCPLDEYIDIFIDYANFRGFSIESPFD